MFKVKLFFMLQVSMTKIEFDPSRLPVDPALGRANLTFGYSGSDNFSELSAVEETTVPIVIDVPFNFLNPVSVHVCVYVCV